MATKNPQDKALADVEKAYRDFVKADEKHSTAQKKAEELGLARARADRTLLWTASHPDLPEDFSLDEFVATLNEPFEENAPDDVPDDFEVAQVTEERAAAAEEADVEPADVEDPFADVGDENPFDEPEPEPKPRARRGR